VAARRTGQQTQGGFCPLCGGGRSSGGGWWKWILGAVVLYVLVQNYSGTDTGKGETDYKPPSQTQQDTKKCDPDALLQLGCTP
jgi:hypothetical protein